MFTENLETKDMNIPRELLRISQDSQTDEDKELLEKIKKKFSLGVDPMGKVAKLALAFGDLPYTFTYEKAKPDDEDAPKPMFSNILSTKTYQALGYECLESADAK